MKRRDFLSSAMMAGGMLALNACRKPNEQVFTDTTSDNGSIIEPARTLTVLDSTEVLVVGGGPAGVAAAIAAARAGAKTCLLERYNHLGGLWTGGLVLPLLSTHGMARSGKSLQVIHGVGGEMAARLKNMGMAIDEVNPTIDPEAGKFLLDVMMREAGVKVLYHTWAAQVVMEGRSIKGVVVESKSGRQVVLAKVVIDCTGDGDVVEWAGEPFEVIKYAIGMNFRVGNTDRVNSAAPGFVEQYVGLHTPLPGVSWYNVWGEVDQDALNVENLSRLQQKLRMDIWKKIEDIRKMPGYEQVYFLDSASQIGVRVSRVLQGEYCLTLDDTMTYRAFDDAVGVSGAWTAIPYKGRKVYPGERPWWQIPYRSLLPKRVDNLLVAGRCFCFERDLLEDARIIGTCLVTGQGAGAGAALAVRNDVRPREVKAADLRTLLLRQNVWFG